MLPGDQCDKRSKPVFMVTAILNLACKPEFWPILLLWSIDRLTTASFRV
jgi:hypothetical protein